MNIELNVVERTKEIPRRVSMQDLSLDRVESLREAVIDFSKRSRSFGRPMGLWAYFSRIIQGKEEADLWWILKEDQVTGFCVVRLYQDFDGGWTAYVLFGWSRSDVPTMETRHRFLFIVDDYLSKGVDRVQFTTRRNPRVFQRFAGLSWHPVGTLFELRRNSNG